MLAAGLRRWRRLGAYPPLSSIKCGILVLVRRTEL